MSISIKRLYARVSLISIVLTAVPLIAAAAEGTIQVDVNSAYVWRGITLNDGPVVQPSLNVGVTSNLSVNVWGNLDCGDYDGAFQRNEFSEVDLSATYGVSVGPVDLALVYAEYLYPHQGTTNGATPGTREVSATAQVPLVGDLALQGKLCYDVDEVKAFYASLGFAYSMSFMEEALSVDVSASAGWAEKQWAEANSGGTEGGLHEYNVMAVIGYAVSDNVKAGACIGYTGSLDKDVLPEQDVDVYGGVSVGVDF